MAATGEPAAGDPEPATAAPEPSKRESCARCRRPPRVCYCASLPSPPLATANTRVLVVQHRHEKHRRNAISSVPVLAQVLDEASVTIVTVDDAGLGARGTNAALDELLYHVADVSQPATSAVAFERVFVLFPDAAAKTLSAELLESRGSLSPATSAPAGAAAPPVNAQRSTLLVVIDGTWTEAKKIVFHARTHLDALATQRRTLGQTFEFVCLESSDDATSTPRQSIYGELRREPMEGCMSTLEAVALALQVLEPRATSVLLCDALLRGFEAMVAIQTQFMQQGKQQALAKHNGVTKSNAVREQQQKKQREATPSDGKEAAKTGGAGAAVAREPREGERERQTQQPLRLQREYVFFTTLVDFRQRKQFVQQGEPVTCTYDEARSTCQELNRERKRGQRLAVLPREAFLQQQRQQDESG